MSENRTYLNEFHRKHSQKMTRKVSLQPLMSLPECIEQAKRLKDQPPSHSKKNS